MIDSHAHLNFPQFSSDLDQTITRAKENGIDTFINIGATFQNTKESLTIAKQNPEIFAVLGIHPCSAEEWSQEVENFIDKNASYEKVVGIGECGVDYFRTTPAESRTTQHLAFRSQIHLARKHNLPFVIHCRNAAGTSWRDEESASSEIWQILQEENYYNCVFHCFAEDLEFAKKLWEKGIYVSFNGTITYPKNSELREVAKQCPSELYILETDCPFLPPQSKRGQRNEPAYILEFADHISELRGIPTHQVATETTINTTKLFKLPIS